MSNEVVKIQIDLNIGISNANQADYHEIPKSEWDAMSEDEQESYLNQVANDHVNNYVDCAAWVVV